MTYRKRTLDMQANRIEAVLARHKVSAHVRGGVVTPRFIQFQLRMAVGTKVRKVASLAEEIAMALGKREARIYRKGADINVEVPRSKSEPIRLLPLCTRLASVPSFTCVLGVEEDGTPLLVRLISPDVAHILIAGTTGSGKTGLARTVLTSLAAYNRPDELQIILIDPKGRGFAPISKLPNVHVPMTSSAEEAIIILQNLVTEMERRDNSGVSSPRIVIAVDELADLIVSGGSVVEGLLTRISQRGREAGLHIVACTQKPTASLIGGAMKANFPVRLVGAVASKDEARYATGMSESGAEKLEGKGDFLLVARGAAVRFQSAWVGPHDLREIMETLRQQGTITGSNTENGKKRSEPDNPSHKQKQGIFGQLFGRRS